MAFYAVFRKTCRFMIRILGTGIIIVMTADTIIPDAIESQIGFGGMAFDTT
jgi:hypothetical protein